MAGVPAPDSGPDTRIAANGLTFRAGEQGFVFYDDAYAGRMSGNQIPRTWAFTTIDEAATWLKKQFPPTTTARRRR